MKKMRRKADKKRYVMILGTIAVLCIVIMMPQIYFSMMDYYAYEKEHKMEKISFELSSDVKDIAMVQRLHEVLNSYYSEENMENTLLLQADFFQYVSEEENESVIENRKKIVVLGSGPIRIGQGVEFDYSTVHAVKTIKEAGYEAIIINNNPETVSTDYTTSDKLYFEPLCVEDVMNVIEMEKPDGIIVSFGGQTAINLAEPLEKRGVKLMGADCAAIEKSENRDAFEKLLSELSIPKPKGQAVTCMEDGVKAAEEIGYPVLVRPSFVLGGRAMQIVAKEEHLRHYLKTAVEIDAILRNFTGQCIKP